MEHKHVCHRYKFIPERNNSFSFNLYVLIEKKRITPPKIIKWESSKKKQ